MPENNFKKLLEEDEQRYNERYDARIRSNLTGSLGLFRFVGHMLDTFLPKIFDLFVVSLGGRIKSNDARHDASPPSQAGGMSTKAAAKPGEYLDQDSRTGQ